jgi:hypothetical protein
MNGERNLTGELRSGIVGSLLENATMISRQILRKSPAQIYSIRAIDSSVNLTDGSIASG